MSSASINITTVGPHFLTITGHPVELLPFSPLFFMIFRHSLRMRIPSHINGKRKYSCLFLRNDTSVVVVQKELVFIQVNRFKRKEKRREVSLASNMTFRGNSLIALSRGSQDDCWFLVMLFALDNSWGKVWWEKGARLNRASTFHFYNSNKQRAHLRCFRIVTIVQP